MTRDLGRRGKLRAQVNKLLTVALPAILQDCVEVADTEHL